MNHSYSKEAAAKVRQYLMQLDINFTFNEETGVFKFSTYTDNITCDINIHMRATDFFAYGTFPILGNEQDSAAMAQLAEFVCRANSGRPNGNFELDFKDGEIRYKTYYDFEGLDTPTKEMIHNSIHCIVAVFCCYGPGILKVLIGDMPAAKAIRACEHSIWFYRNANASNEADTDEEEYDETQNPDLSNCESSFADPVSTNQEGCSDEIDWDNLLGDD